MPTVNETIGEMGRLQLSFPLHMINTVDILI